MSCVLSFHFLIFLRLMDFHPPSNTKCILNFLFAFSVFYVFFEQYLTSWKDMLSSLGISLLAIFLVSLVLMAFNLSAACIIVLTISMTIINITGFMYWWGISLNALSTVNLVMVCTNRMLCTA